MEYTFAQNTNESFCDGVPDFEELSTLSRPQVVIDDANFLSNFSLQSQKLTLRDILMESFTASAEALEEFSPIYSLTMGHTNDSKIPVTKINLDKNVLSYKKQQLHTLIELYESEREWLSCGSRLWFGQLSDECVSLFIDCSDTVCFSDQYIQYSEALNLLFTEQIQSCKRASVSVFGTRVVSLNISKRISALEKVIKNVKPQGTCNFLNCLQIAFKSCCKSDTLFIIVSSRPDQDLDLLYDYAVQMFKGQYALKIHVAAVNVDKNVQIFLQRLTKAFKGHYHHYSSNKTKSDALEDTLLRRIELEKRNASRCISDIENILNDKISDFLIDDLRQLSLVVQWNADDRLSSSLYAIPCSTDVWLKTYGLDALGLNLYHILAPDTFNQLSEYVPVIDRTALSTVYDVMPKFTWKDGTQKYLHIDVHKLENYITDLKVHTSLLQSRLVWLQSGSRVVFGNLEEERILVVIDSSLKSYLHQVELKQHLKTLLHEQISHKESFNIISYAGNDITQWQDHLVIPDEETVVDALSWILCIKPRGNNNLLACLQTSIDFCLMSPDSSPIGIYIVLSSIPDQDADHISEYVEQRLSGSNVRFHTVLYQPVPADSHIEATMLKGIGRLGEDLDLGSYTETLKEIGTLHRYVYGEFQGSDDHAKLTREISKTNESLEIVQGILDNYIVHCKRNVPPAVIEEKSCPQSLLSVLPINPRPTLTSLARMNCNTAKLKNLSTGQSIQKKRRKGLYLTLQTFYTGQGLRKGQYYDLVELNGFNITKSLIPSKETYLPSSEWLEIYGLESLRLYNKKNFTSNKTGFKHVTADGKIVQLSMNHQQLYKLLLQIKQVKQRYFSRLQWLLSDSRLVFGCLVERKIVLLVDVSASMNNHFQELTNQMFDLLDDQLTFSHKSRYFNVVSYAQDVNLWRPQLTHCTQDNRAEVQQWINSLTIGGSSCLLSGLNACLNLEPDAVYVITDGETDHSHKFTLSQIIQLKRLYAYNWKIHTIAYYSRSSEQHDFLKQLAHSTSGRYHCFPNTDFDSMGIFRSEVGQLELGDDLKMLVKEMQLADYVINKLLYYMGRVGK